MLERQEGRVSVGALASFAPPANFDWLTRLGARAIVSNHFPGSFLPFK